MIPEHTQIAQFLIVRGGPFYQLQAIYGKMHFVPVPECSYSSLWPGA
jgi:hypothetical protein